MQAFLGILVLPLIIAIVLIYMHGGDLYNNLFIINVIIAVFFSLYFIWKKINASRVNNKIINHDQDVLKNAINDFQKNIPTLHSVKVSPLELTLQEQYDYLFNGTPEGGYQISGKLKEIYGVERMNLKELIAEIKKLDGPANNRTLRDAVDGYDLRRYQFNSLLRSFVRNLLEPSIRESGWDNNNLLLSDDFENKAKEMSHRIGVGVSGENEVSQYIKDYIKNGILLENVRIIHQGKSAESDMIYITTSAIYSIEVKNFGKSGKWGIEIASDGQWRKISSDGSKISMSDVGEQINHHIKTLKNYLHAEVPVELREQLNRIPLIPVIIIANNEVILENQSDLKIFRKSSFVRYLEEEKSDIVSEEFVHRIGKILQDNSKEAIKYPIENVMAQAENMLLRLLYFKEIEDRIEYWGEQIYNEYHESVQTDKGEVL